MEIENQQPRTSQSITTQTNKKELNELNIIKNDWKWKKTIFTILVTILWIIFIWIVIVFFLRLRWANNNFNEFEKKTETNSINIDQKSWLYKFAGYSHDGNGNNIEYHLYLADNEYYTTSADNDCLWLYSTEYGWLNWLYKFNNYIYLDLSFSEWKLINWRIVDRNTKTDLWDPSNIDWLSVIWEEHIKYYSKLLTEKSTYLNEDDLIYNDTEKTQTFTVKDHLWNEEEKIIEVGEIYINHNDSFRWVDVNI